MTPTPTLAVVALFAAGIAGSAFSPAQAADLSGQSRLGRVFAEPLARDVRVEMVGPVDEEAVFFVPPKVPGYYGRPTDFTYRNYYGTSPLVIFGRLPYVCGLYGSC